MAHRNLLTLGPVLFNWAPDTWRDFYFRAADEAPLDIVYVGETVCAKRAPFIEPRFAEVVERLRTCGKRVIVSLLAEVASRVDRRLVDAMLSLDGVTFEVNDASALDRLSGRPHTIGPFFNVYNEGALGFLAHRGATAFCLPPELPGTSLAAMGKAAEEHGAEIEVQVFGRIPLALSARCYHARAHGLSKDGCQFVCDRDPDGMELKTLDGVPFLAINGIQTLSHHYLNLVQELDLLREAGVSRIRLSPDSRDMVAVARIFRDVLDGRMGGNEASSLLAAGRDGIHFSNGFHYRKPGTVWTHGGRSVGQPVGG